MKILHALLHLDQTMYTIIGMYEEWTHAILFIIVTLETGLILTPFLPGDSLLFVAGSFSAKGLLNARFLYFILIIASTLGNLCNYAVGRSLSKQILEKRRIPFIKESYIQQAENYYIRYGALTLFVTRFIPIARTFAPFLAGVAKMNFSQFVLYTISGGILWVTSLFWLGYFFGNLPFVEKHFTSVIFGIIFISIAPSVFFYIKSKLTPKQPQE